MAVHFVNFKDPRREKDERYHNAVKVMGEPDFIHRYWDIRAKAEVMPDDVAIFAVGNYSDKPRMFAYDDSAYF